METVVGVILTSTTKYNVTVKAHVTVRPTGEIRLVQAATEAKIKSIVVKENQVFKQGDAIARLGKIEFNHPAQPHEKA